MGRVVGALALLLCLHTPAVAVHTRFWELQGLERMLSGKTEGLSLTPEGTLLLAPDLLSLPLGLPEFPPQPFLWRAVEDRQGFLYVGSGIRGLVYRVSPEGEVEPFFQAPELEVHALAVDGSGALLVGASPPGRVYLVQPDGSAELFFEPLERYIWDLAVDRDGALFVATGEQGVLYKVSPEGEGTIYFDSDEPHLVSLALDVDGMVYVGSSGSGRLYRVGPDGTAQVVMDSDAQEVAHVALTPDGTVFAAVNELVPPQEKTKEEEDQEPKERLAGELPRAATPALLGLEDLAGTREEMLPDRRQETALTLRSTLYRIPPVGAPTAVWTSETAGIHSLLVEPDGRVYFGTGVPGRLYLLEDGQTAPRLLARFSESQVTSLAGGSDSVLYVATSNPGRLYRAVEEHGHSGEYLSRIRDAGGMAHWGQVHWDASTPAGSRVEVSSRSGNSSAPDNTWSDWSAAYDRADGSRISSPPARFLQLRARLSRLGEAPTPWLRSLQVSYQEENRRPELSELEILPADQEDPGSNPTRREGTPRAMDIRWQAVDLNGDELEFDLFLIPVQDPEQRTELALGWSESTFRWDTAGTPAGTYRVQLHASDGPDNDHRSALDAQITSEPLVVDRTPPTLEVLSSSGQGSQARITFQVTDAVSPVVRAEYITGDPPRRHRIIAADGLDDQKVERYELIIPDLAPGTHRIHLTAEDREGNRASTTVSVEVEP